MTQQEFDEKLESLGVKEQFYRAVKEHGKTYNVIYDTFLDTIQSAFVWMGSFEGHDFWEDIAYEKVPVERVLEEYPEEYLEHLSKL